MQMIGSEQVPSTGLKQRPTTLMTVGQAADYLGLAVSTLNKWRCHGGGPVFIKMGRAVRYRVEDLERYVCDAKASSTNEFGV